MGRKRPLKDCYEWLPTRAAWEKSLDSATRGEYGRWPGGYGSDSRPHDVTYHDLSSRRGDPYYHAIRGRLVREAIESGRAATRNVDAPGGPAVRDRAAARGPLRPPDRDRTGSGQQPASRGGRRAGARRGERRSGGGHGRHGQDAAR